MGILKYLITVLTYGTWVNVLSCIPPLMPWLVWGWNAVLTLRTTSIAWLLINVEWHLRFLSNAPTSDLHPSLLSASSLLRHRLSVETWSIVSNLCRRETPEPRHQTKGGEHAQRTHLSAQVWLAHSDAVTVFPLAHLFFASDLFFYFPFPRDGGGSSFGVHCTVFRGIMSNTTRSGMFALLAYIENKEQGC